MLRKSIVGLVPLAILAVAASWYFFAHAHPAVSTRPIRTVRVSSAVAPASLAADATPIPPAPMSATPRRMALPPSDPRLRVIAANDLYPLDVELRARAIHGDADAVVALDDVQNDCLPYFLGHDDDFQTRLAEKYHPEAKPRMEALLARQRARCGHFNRADLVPHERMTELLRAAAAQGNMAAKARLLEMYEDLDKLPDDELVADVKEIAASRDPLAWKDLSSVMSMRVESRNQIFGLPAGTDETNQAWMVAACELGMDCGPDGPILQFLCRTQGLCSYGSVEAMIQDALLSPMSYRRMRTDVQLILERTQPHG